MTWVSPSLGDPYRMAYLIPMIQLRLEGQWVEAEVWFELAAPWESISFRPAELRTGSC